MSTRKTPITVKMVIKLGIRKSGRARELAALIDHAYEQVKAQTGERMNLEYFKKPWKSDMELSIEGNPEPVKLFLAKIRVPIETMGLRTIPSNYWEI